MQDKVGKFRIVDLSYKLVSGKEERRLAVRKEKWFIDSLEKRVAFHDSFYCDIDMMSHVGTHVEVPSHFFDKGKDVTQIPLTVFLGRTVLLDLGFIATHEALTPEILEKASAGMDMADAILILRGPSSKVKPYCTPESAHWFIKKGIKMLGWDDTISIEETEEMTREFHDILLGHDIPFLEAITNLDKIKETEFFLVALPLNIAGLDGCPVRAVAIEGMKF